jgi:prolyl-tRNA synthetase
MGSYGIGIGRALACIAEVHNDDYGLIWPITVAPYQVHLTVLAGRQDAVADLGSPSDVAERLYTELQEAGIEVLYDDRDDSPGVKFMDADLIGIPLRLTVGSRSLKRGGVEFKRRDAKERDVVALDAVLSAVERELAALREEVMANVVEVPFKT